VKFDKQVQFSRSMKTNGQVREFNFLKIKSASVPTYHVDVSDERGNRHYFSLVYEGSAWKIGKTTVPGWISNIEAELGDVVSEYERVG
jgi:hypothetical protein